MNAITRQWDRFWEERLAKLILPDTLVGPERIHNLYVLAKRVEKEKVPGDVIECGVCNGGTAALLARFATRSRLNRTIWLLDSFQGMPVTTPEDGDAAKAHVGKEVGDVERVKAVLQRVGAEMSRVRIVSGWFQDTFPTVSASQIALLNIDADWYESVKLCLETFYDRVVRGGFISFDDYGHWPGCRKAVDEFFQARRLPYKLHQVDYTAQWFQKE
ncbi:MAG: TylF/MycF/NovP-related O-methyltransferase [Candidatus Acidiferrum sp.]